MEEKQRALLWIRIWLGVLILGLLVSGMTAIPLVREVGFLHRVVHSKSIFEGELQDWAQRIYAGLLDTNSRYPFLFYGTDWLAFGHFAIAIAFMGPIRDPVRNVWVIDFGIIICLLIVPYALIFGALRGIPMWWRLIDCSFGILGLLPLILARRAVRRIS